MKPIDLEKSFLKNYPSPFGRLFVPESIENVRSQIHNGAIKIQAKLHQLGTMKFNFYISILEVQELTYVSFGIETSGREEEEFKIKADMNIEIRDSNLNIPFSNFEFTNNRLTTPDEPTMLLDDFLDDLPTRFGMRIYWELIVHRVEGFHSPVFYNYFVKTQPTDALFEEKVFSDEVYYASRALFDHHFGKRKIRLGMILEPIRLTLDLLHGQPILSEPSHMLMTNICIAVTNFRCESVKQMYECQLMRIPIPPELLKQSIGKVKIMDMRKMFHRFLRSWKSIDKNYLKEVYRDISEYSGELMKALTKTIFRLADQELE